jgi:hypothetical protein
LTAAIVRLYVAGGHSLRDIAAAADHIKSYETIRTIVRQADVSPRARADASSTTPVPPALVEPPRLGKGDWVGGQETYGCPETCTDHRSHILVRWGQAKWLRAPVYRPSEAHSRPPWMSGPTGGRK